MNQALPNPKACLDEVVSKKPEGNREPIVVSGSSPSFLCPSPSPSFRSGISPLRRANGENEKRCGEQNPEANSE